jgi:ribonuclease D
MSWIHCQEIKRALFYAAYLLKEDDPSLDESGKRLFKNLRKWRNETEIKKNLPAYMILKDSALTHLAYLRQDSIAKLLVTRGIGSETVRNFGDLIIKLIKEYAEKELVGKISSVPRNTWKSPSSSWQKHNADVDRPVRAYAPWTNEEDLDLRALVVVV